MIKEQEEKEIIKFADFGVGRKNKSTVANTLARGTPDYMAPELKWIINGNSSAIGTFNP